MSTPKKFWCSCGLGYKTEPRRDRHCVLFKHEPGVEPPPQYRRRARKARVVPDRTKAQ